MDVLPETPGKLTLEHRAPDRTYTLADVTVKEDQRGAVAERGVHGPAHRPRAQRERERLAPLVDAPPDKTLAFVAEMDMGEPDVGAGGALNYSCPMHPEVVSDEPGRCPSCGMKLIAEAASTGFACPMHPDVTSETADPLPGVRHEVDPGAARPVAGRRSRAPRARCPRAQPRGRDGIEWEDDMVDVNKLTTPANTRWKLVGSPTTPRTTRSTGDSASATA